MNIRQFLTIGLLGFLFITGCQQQTQQTTNTKETSIYKYQCDNDILITVAYINPENQSSRAEVLLNKSHYDLPIVRSGSGAKYSDGKYTWWSKGKTGFFQVDGDITVDNCQSE